MQYYINEPEEGLQIAQGVVRMKETLRKSVKVLPCEVESIICKYGSDYTYFQLQRLVYNQFHKTWKDPEEHFHVWFSLDEDGDPVQNEEFEFEPTMWNQYESNSMETNLELLDLGSTVLSDTDQWKMEHLMASTFIRSLRNRKMLALSATPLHSRGERVRREDETIFRQIDIVNNNSL